MTRGSGSSGGSYRQWAASERAAQREREQRKKQAEKDRLAAEAAARDDEAVAKTEAVEQRVTELESLLRSSLGRDPRIRFDSLKISAAVPPLDLGPLANPVPAPQWADFAPERPTALGRMFGAGQRFQASCAAAERAFADAQADYQRGEAARQRGIVAARAEWTKAADEAERQADAHNAHVAEIAAGFRAHDRFAVSEYVQAALDRSPYPEGFPAERQAGYVPESLLLAVEWFLPTFDIIPEHKAFKRISSTRCSPAERSCETVRLLQCPRVLRSAGRLAGRAGVRLEQCDPAAAAGCRAAIDRELVDEALRVWLYNPHPLTVLAARVGSYQFHPYWGLRPGCSGSAASRASCGAV
jgi:restriction system protein